MLPSTSCLCITKANLAPQFVVDNNWVINESSPKEPDHEGNVNNFLTPEQIAGTNPAAAILNTVAPGATTTAMAGEQPLESRPEPETPADIPGGFPATPANELDKPIGVAPLPAAEGGVNPVTLAPGEPVPQTITAQNVDSHVKLDKESYEKSDALPGTELPPVSKASIPEAAGLAVGGNKPVTINTVGPGATTANLAGAVALESKVAEGQVPEVVKESQAAAGVDPEASAVPAEVGEKKALEDELKEKIPEAPSTSEGIPELGTIKSEKDGAVVGAVASAGATVAAAALAAADSVTSSAAPVVSNAATAATDAANKNLPDSVKEQLPVAAQEALASQNKEEKIEEVSPQVPAEVKESIAEAGKAPEAAANTEAVIEKKEVESELLKEIKPVPAVGETSTTEEKKSEAAVKADTKAAKAESKLESEAVKSEAKADKESTKVEKAEAKEATADTTKEKLAAKAEKAEAKVEGKAEVTKAAVTGTAATKAEEKHEEKAAKTSEPTPAADATTSTPAAAAAPAANGSEGKPAESTASSSKPTETSVETKKKNRLSSMFSKLKQKMK